MPDWLWLDLLVSFNLLMAAWHLHTSRMMRQERRRMQLLIAELEKRRAHEEDAGGVRTMEERG